MTKPRSTSPQCPERGRVFVREHLIGKKRTDFPNLNEKEMAALFRFRYQYQQYGSGPKFYCTERQLNFLQSLIEKNRIKKDRAVALPTRIWFDIGFDWCPEGLKRQALTMKPESKLYERDSWIGGRDAAPQMMTAYTSLPDDFEKVLAKETRLVIVEHDTHYTLQVCVDVAEMKRVDLDDIERRLQKFVAKHFKPYVPAEA